MIYSVSFCLAIGFGLLIRGEYAFPSKPFPIAIVLLGAVSLIALHLFLDPLISLIPPSELLNKLVTEIVKEPRLYFFMIVLAAPILEELFFRGIILDGYLKNYEPKQAVLVSAFLFGAFHGNLPQGVGAFLSGILIGWIYWKTNSILAAISIHLINNFVSYISVMLTPKDQLLMNMRDSIGIPLYYWLIVIGSGIVAVAGIGVLAKYYLKKR